MTEEVAAPQDNVEASIMAAFEQGYKQGWIHSQQALAEWVQEIGDIDKENSNFYKELGQVIAKLEIVQQDDVATTDVSEVSQD